MVTAYWSVTVFEVSANHRITDGILPEILGCAGFLAKSQRGGLIKLTFKKGDRLDPFDWRPITLLNVGYKIASRAIVGRLLKVIHLVVCGGLDLWCTGQVHWRWYFLVKGCSALLFY